MLQNNYPTAEPAISRISLLAGLLTVGVAGTALLGWLLDLPFLRSLLEGHVAMRANTAVGLVICGLLLFIACGNPGKFRSTIRWLLALALLALGVLTLIQYIFGVDLKIDNAIIYESSDAVMTASPGRMAPTTAACFTLFAAALLIDHWQTGHARAASRILTTLLLLIALVSVMGYVYGAPLMYMDIEGITAMSLTSALLFLVLGIGVIWLRSEFGLPAMMVEKSVLGTYIRALLPMILGAPLLVGAAVAAGYGRAFQGQFAIAITSLGSVVAAGIVAAISIVVLRRSEDAIYIKDRALDATSNGIVITDHRSADEPIVFVNNAFTKITGYSVDESVGTNCRFLNRAVDKSGEVFTEMRRCIAQNLGGTFEIPNSRKDGSIFWNRLNLAPVADYEGKVTHYVGIMSDVTERRAQDAQLEQALGDAYAANNMRDTFVRLVSHELRTPLNAALTWIRLMEIDESEKTRNKGLEVVANSIDSQSRLIDDLVDVTRFAAAGARLESETVDLKDLVITTTEELRPTIEAEQTLEISIEPGNYAANVDPVRIRQIIRNLLTNANKYTPPGGQIGVYLSLKDKGALLRVADSGKGLSESDISQVFEPFWRAKSHQPGLGVGLSIVSSLVSAHGGHIEVRSDGEDKGSEFSVWLPTAGSPEMEVRLQDLGQEIGSGTGTFEQMMDEAAGIDGHEAGTAAPKTR